MPTAAPDFEPVLLANLRPWAGKVRRLADRRVRDAAAHGALAAAAGDPGSARRSPHRAAGAERLVEVHAEALALVRDAREEFYADAFARWRPHLDGRHHRIDAGPSAAGRRFARNAVINGVTPADELLAIVGEAQRGYAAALMQTADGRREGRATPLDVWQAKASRRLADRIVGVLSDSQIALFFGVLVALEK